MSEQRRPRIMPPIWLVLTLGAQYGLLRLFPTFVLIPEEMRRAGWWVVAVALVAFFWSAALFGRHRTTIEPGRESEALIRSGLYRISRNPIYSAMVLLLLGAAIRGGSVLGFLPIVPFVWWIRTRFIAMEERMLAERFGSEYGRYCDRVRRWI